MEAAARGMEALKRISRMTAALLILISICLTTIAAHAGGFTHDIQRPVLRHVRKRRGEAMTFLIFILLWWLLGHFGIFK